MWWGLPPRLVCSLIAIEIRNKDEGKVWDVLNLTILDFTTIGHILVFPGQVKQIIVLFGKINVPFLQIMLKLRKIEKETRNTIVFLSSRRIETCAY